ncbi:MAG: hypothetical protein MUO51_06910 [Woeseiaceae bacterium]|nr:hypothetical protein [Woeseiaceae bacterium]
MRVHPELLADQGLPAELLDEKIIWKERYRFLWSSPIHACPSVAQKRRVNASELARDGIIEIVNRKTVLIS